MSEISEKPPKLFLELGDIIKVVAPTNSEINEKMFFVQYLDENEVDLIDIDTTNMVKLGITSGKFDDKSIESVIVDSRPANEGYARQNGLLPGVWITIQLGGDMPTTVNGQITSLEEDMIEISRFPDNQKIYIDFAYKGIPKNLPIESIRPFTPPIQEKVQDFPALPLIPGESPPSTEEGEDLDIEVVQGSLPIETHSVKAKRRVVLLDADDVVFGEDMEEITELIPVSESERRYGLETQSNDLLNDLLSTIPTSARTKKVLNSIHIMIERFRQLREMYSKLSGDGEFEMPDMKTADYKPLVKVLEVLSQKLYWLLPVVRNRKLLYDVDMDDDKDIADVVETTLAEAQLAIYDIVTQYKTNNIPDGQNKYKYFYKELNPLFTPFVEPDLKANVVSEIRTGTNINTIVSNFDDLFSTVFCNATVKQKRFMMERYIQGLDLITQSDVKSPKLKVVLEKLTRSDMLSILGFIILPEAVVRYSQINLPKTSIYQRATLNTIPLMYFSLLNSAAPIVSHIVEEGEKALIVGKEDYLRNISSFIFNETNTFDDRGNSSYADFLNAIIPRTRSLFNLVKKYINNNTSYLSILYYLQPFLIYPDDITFKQYEEIINFMRGNILELKKHLATQNRHFLDYLNYKYSSNIGFKNSFLFTLIDSTKISTQIDDNLMSLYNISKETTSEFIRKILLIDDGRLFMSGMAFEDIELFVTGDIDEMIQERLSDLMDDSSSKSSGECKNFVLAKHYIDIGELREDDGIPDVYFDTKYDTTRYDIIEEFREQQATMASWEFANFLTDHLVQNVGLDRHKGAIEADAMIAGKRRVEEGDYCYITDDENIANYYVRDDNNMWIKVPDLEGEAPSPSIFCNLKKQCLAINKACGDIHINRNKIKLQLINEMLSQFDKDLTLDMDSIRTKFLENLKTSAVNIKKLRWLEKLLMDRYDIVKSVIGDSVRDRQVKVSPNAELRDLILSQGDFVKKQNDIKSFISKKCRPSQLGEDQYWFYCIESNLKLLPTFYEALANAYFAGKYIEVLDEISALRGTKSDDGDKIVDKHSGYLIRMLEFDEAEGYDQTGYKIVSRALLEKDIGDVLIGMSYKTTDTIRTKDGEMIRNVLATLNKQLGVSTGSDTDFIVKSVETTLDDYLPSEDVYIRRARAAKKSGKKMGSYIDFHDEALLLLTVAYYLVTAQTMMPSVRTDITFKGCGPRSFVGYPLEGEGNFVSLKYICCTVLKLRSRTRPWQRLPKLSREQGISILKAFMTKLKHLIDKEVLSNESVQDRISAKLQYMQEKPEGLDIDGNFDVRRWRTFLPPLHPIKITDIKLLASTFEGNLTNAMRKASPVQFSLLMMLSGKITLFSLQIQEQIQRVVNKETLLLENLQNELLVENACCNSGDRDTVSYFASREKGIVVTNKRVADYEALYASAFHLLLPTYLFDPQDTKLKYPPVPSAFSEKTIYHTFLRFCDYNTGLILSDELVSICGKNASEYKASDDIATKIAILKREGKNYTQESFLNLMDIVNRSNIVDLDLTSDVFSPRANFERLMKNPEMLRDLDGTDIHTFMDLMLGVLDRFEATRDADEGGDDALGNFERFLETKIEENTSLISEFTELESGHPQLSEFLNTIDVWKLRGENIYMSLEDETAVTFYEYSRTYLFNILRIYPTIIKNYNKIDLKNPSIPPHWQSGPQKLSEGHIKDIKGIISMEHSELLPFYGNEVINKLSEIMDKDVETHAILTIVSFLPLFSNIRLRPGSPRTETILNGDMIKKIMKFFISMAFVEYIRTLQNMGAPGQTTRSSKMLSEVVELDIIRGKAEQAKTSIANLLIAYLQILQKQKKTLNISNYEIDQNVLKSKEKEKAKITKTLGDLAPDERRVQNIMKNQRLGEWSLGETRALFIYDEDQYEKERAEIEEDALREMRVDGMDGVTARTREIFRMDHLEEQVIQDRVRSELNAAIMNLRSDDDFGEDDGDMVGYMDAIRGD